MTALVVDGPNVFVRALKAAERSRSFANRSTATLVIFINSLSKHVREERPHRLVVCWEGDGDGWREAVEPLYKAQRNRSVSGLRGDSFSLVRSFCALAGVPQDSRPGYEADDLVAAYWRASTEPVVILSSDKDFLQLLDPPTQQVRLSSAGTPTDRWDSDRVKQVWGCKPKHIPLAMALAGDHNDGVPGIPGFGMKTAIKHLSKSGWDLKAVTDPRVVAAQDRVQTNLRLVNLRQGPLDLAVPDVPTWKPTDFENIMYIRLVDFLAALRLRDVLTRLSTGSLWKDPLQDNRIPLF